MIKKLSCNDTANLILFSVLLAVLCGISWLFCPHSVAAMETGASILLLIYFGIHTSRQRHDMVDYLKQAHFSSDEAAGGNMLIPVPAAIMNLKTNGIVWCNQEFCQTVSGSDCLDETPITKFFPEFRTDWIVGDPSECPDVLTAGGKRYRIYGSPILSTTPNTIPTAMLYFVDVTELSFIKDEYDLSRPVVAMLLVDNYDELTANLPDRDVSSISASLDDTITAWASKTCGVLRKLERNRYLFIFEDRYLPGIIDSKFAIMDSVRSITNELGVPATLSIGVGRGGETLQKSYEYAVLSVDMCLSRGGDQAVLKDRYNFSFYGGKTKEAERRTKIKSRVMAVSLQELVTASPKVFIMGHKNADFDAVGAAVGVMSICRKLHKNAHIVIDMDRNASKRLLEKLTADQHYKNLFISPAQAVEMADKDSMLIVVDTNRPSQVECPELLDICEKIAVIDHHRRAADYIDNAVLNLHEPYASSACELVTEVTEILLDREDLLPIETLSLLAGIFLDTKNFSVRTGSRTFEAAALLRKYGADPVTVKLLFQNDLSATLNRYQILQHVEMYHGDIALCCLDYTSDRITAAQAADELLSISGIEASFVFYPDGDRVICSARSIGETNVQIVLEPLGGGGNQATAGAQISGMTTGQVGEALKQSIDNFFS